MDAGLDTGAMLSKIRVPIGESDTAASLHDALARAGAAAIVAALENVAAWAPEMQDNALATYAAKLTKDEAQLNWSEPADRLARAVRAYNPAPGAWTLLDGAPLKVWSAQACPGSGAAGEVLRADAEQLVHSAPALHRGIVGTGDGVAVAGADLDVLHRFEIEIDGREPVFIAARKRGEIAVGSIDEVELVGRNPLRSGGDRHQSRRGDVRLFIAEPCAEVRGVLEQVELGVGLNIGRNGTFADAAIGVEGRKAVVVTPADAVQVIEEFDHVLEIELVEALDHRRVVGTRNAGELVRQGFQREQIVGHLRLGRRSAPGIVLNEAIGRTHLVFGVNDAEIEAFEDRVIEVPAAAQLCLVDLVAEEGVAESVAGGLNVARVQRIDAGVHGVGDDRQVVLVVHRLLSNAKHRRADRSAGAIRIVGT
ncbi:MAG: hypothetical protein B7Y31_11315 [Novosphingobium sp. 16-62-11]|nr:MAG: hypothetical protein B7Y31_11315 [Novosphingobium sp. 16-62-11]